MAAIACFPGAFSGFVIYCRTTSNLIPSNINSQSLCLRDCIHYQGEIYLFLFHGILLRGGNKTICRGVPRSFTIKTLPRRIWVQWDIHVSFYPYAEDHNSANCYFNQRSFPFFLSFTSYMS